MAEYQLGRLIAQPLSGVDAHISAFCIAFGDLRKTFDSRLTLNTAIVLSQSAVTIGNFRAYLLYLNCKEFANNLPTGRDQLLSNLKPVEMTEYKRTGCLPNTRSAVISSVIDWITDESSVRQKVFWLHGLAGSGKSTISTTIALMLRDLHRLGAFFFFDRGILERNAATLIRTLAYQLALSDARIGDAISRIVENTPRIAEMPLDFQITSLLSAKALELVEWSGPPIVLVIDALDECGGSKHLQLLLPALSEGFSDLPSFIRVLMVSRPDTDIRDTFSAHEAVYPYHLTIDSVATQQDISAFLRHGFRKIRRKNQHLCIDWPGDDNISALTNSADGLFVWASTACLYIDGYDPDKRLRELITHQSEINSSDPFAQLDQLYKTGLQSAGCWDDLLFRSDCCNTLGIILCAGTPLSHSIIDIFLDLPPNRACLQIIFYLGCVLRITESERIRILHPSFHDYLTKRCSVEPWSIDLKFHNKEFALRCIKLLDKELRENICDMTLPHFTQIKPLPDAISYACKFWTEHICLISDAADYIVNQIYDFLGKHLLHWMEALALLKSHDYTIRSLQNLIEWLRVCRLIYALDAWH